MRPFSQIHPVTCNLNTTSLEKDHHNKHCIHLFTKGTPVKESFHVQSHRSQLQRQQKIIIISKDMEQLRCKNRSSSTIPGVQSCRSLQLPKMPLTRHVLLILYTFIAYTAESSGAFILAETLCGGELVDTLQFVCGDRGFYFEKNTARSNRRSSRGIVEECCFRSCDLDLLETYCAKPVKNERDLSTVPATSMPPLNKDMYHKHSHTKYSKYDIWQRKSTHRLRRGVPAIVRARQYRWRVQQIEESQQVLSHRPLTTLPVTQPRPVQQDSKPSHN